MKKILMTCVLFALWFSCFSGWTTPAYAMDQKTEEAAISEEAKSREVLREFFQALNDGNLEKSRTYLTEENLASLIDPKAQESDISLDFDPFLVQHFQGFQTVLGYAEIKERSGLTSLIPVEYEGYDYTGIVNHILAEYTKSMITQKNFTEQDIEKYLTENLESHKKSQKYQFNVKMIQTEAGWKILGNSENQELFDAITGGLVNKTKNIMDKL